MDALTETEALTDIDELKDRVAILEAMIEGAKIVHEPDGHGGSKGLVIEWGKPEE